MKKLKKFEIEIPGSLIVIIMIIVLSFICAFSSCDYTPNPKEQKKINREQSLEYVEAYLQNWDNFLDMKFNDEDNYYSYAIEEPTTWIYIKINNPELFEEFIVPIKTQWDSLKLVSKEATTISGISIDKLKIKIKLKEIDKTKIKVKKSNNVTINNTNIESIQVSDSILNIL